jgi:hypothetical protein
MGKSPLDLVPRGELPAVRSRYAYDFPAAPRKTTIAAVIVLLLVVICTSVAAIGIPAAMIAVSNALFADRQAESEPAEIRMLDFSAERYLPMLRLLDEADFALLSEQPGFRPQIARGLRAQRCRVFAGYLRSLRADFTAAAAALKHSLAHSTDDRPDLSSALVRTRLRFTYRLLLARVQAYIWQIGFGRVDAAELVKIFDGVCAELRSQSAETAHSNG